MSTSSSDDEDDNFVGLQDLNISNDHFYEHPFPERLLNIKRRLEQLEEEQQQEQQLQLPPNQPQEQHQPQQHLQQKQASDSNEYNNIKLKPLDGFDVKAATKDIPKYGLPQISHSLAAYDLWKPLYPTYLSDDKLRNFHRPKLKHYNLGPQVGFLNRRKAKPFPIKSLALHLFEYHARLKDQVVKAINQGFSREEIVEKFFKIRQTKDLTAKRGHLVLFEYSEEYPPVLSCIGMTSCIRALPLEEPIKKGPPRQLYYSDPKDGQSLEFIENNLYRAPIHKHHAPRCDFLIIRTRNSFYIRSIVTIYTVGQTMPIVAVPVPTGPNINRFRYLLSNSYIDKMFLGSITCPQSLPFKQLMKFFPDITRNTLQRRLLGAGAVFSKDEQVWFRGTSNFGQIPIVDLRRNFTPEQYCLYMSMLAARERLRELNYTETMILPENNACLETEVMAAPWNTTRAVLDAVKGRYYLDLKKHLIDPTGAQREGFSCVPWSKSPLEDEFRAKDANHAEQQNNLANRNAILDKIKKEKLSRLAIYRSESRIIADVQHSALSSSAVLSSDEDELDDDPGEDQDSQRLDKSFEQQLEDLDRMVIGGQSAQELDFEKEELERQKLVTQMTSSPLKNIEVQSSQRSTGSNGSAFQQQQNGIASGRSLLNAKDFNGKILKITRLYSSPDGNIERTEIVRDPKTIALYVQQRNALARSQPAETGKGPENDHMLNGIASQNVSVAGSFAAETSMNNGNKTFCGVQAEGILSKMRSRSNSLNEGELCRAEGTVLRISKTVLNFRALRKHQRQAKAANMCQ